MVYEESNYPVHPGIVQGTLSADDLSRINKWIKWAGKELDTTDKQVQEANQALNEQTIHLKSVIRENKSQQEKIEKQAIAIEGVEAWMRLQRDIVKTFDIGSKVNIIEIDREATITAIYIDRAGTHYWCRVFTNGVFATVKLHSTDVEETQEDLLTVPPTIASGK